MQLQRRSQGVTPSMGARASAAASAPARASGPVDESVSAAGTLDALTSEVASSATPTDGMGDAGRRPSGWGTALGSHRGVTAYSNGGDSRYWERGTYGYMYQCVEYVNRFASQALGAPNMIGTGNAKDYAGGRRSGFSWVPNDGSHAPPTDGDIVVLHGGQFGHVAIVTESSESKTTWIQQNSRSTHSTVGVRDGVLGTWGSYTVAGWQHHGGAPPPATARPEGPQTAGGSYTVVAGDTLSGIAGRVLGDSSQYLAIASLNRLPPPYVIRVGQVLTLPGGAAGARSAAPAAPATAQPAPTSRPAAPVAPAAPAKASSYTVVSGDTLSSIAARVLGDASRYPELAAANGLRAPYVIYPRQVLKVPGAPTPTRAPAPAAGARPAAQTAAPAAAPTVGPAQAVVPAKPLPTSAALSADAAARLRAHVTGPANGSERVVYQLRSKVRAAEGGGISAALIGAVLHDEHRRRGPEDALQDVESWFLRLYEGPLERLETWLWNSLPGPDLSRQSFGLAQMQPRTLEDVVAGGYVQAPEDWLTDHQDAMLRMLADDALAPAIVGGRLRQILDHWAAGGVSLAARPEILATLYSIGLTGSGGVHADPKASSRGEEIARSLPRIEQLLRLP